MPEWATILRLVGFAGGLGLFALAEWRAPRRPRRIRRRRRWSTNLLMPALGSLLTAFLPLLGPFTAVAAAVWAAHHDFGLIPALELSPFWATVGALVILDFAIYWQHRAFHRVGWLWRLHRVHHADPELDVTTGVRFHPVEYLLSALWKAVVVMTIGADVGAVVLFEFLLNFLSLFNHANWRLPAALDRLLRHVIVTPDFHAVHHSQEPDEHHRNFGFNLAWWDYIFGTYRAHPRQDIARMAIGLAAVPPCRAIRPGSVLALPSESPPVGE